MHSKRLYKHALPVFALCFVLSVISAMVFTKYSDLSNDNQSEIGQAMVKPFLQVSPSSNGLAHFSVHDPSPSVGSSITNAGQTAGLAADKNCSFASPTFLCN